MTDPCHFQGGACIHCHATEKGECEGWNAPAITPEFAHRAALREALLICQAWERIDAEIAENESVDYLVRATHSAMARGAHNCANEIAGLLK